MSKEEWRDVKGYEGRYRVSSQGKVYSILSGRMMESNVNQGRPRVNLTHANGSRRPWRIGQIVAYAFLGDPRGGGVVHKDGNLFNNSVENLVYQGQHELLYQAPDRDPELPEANVRLPLNLGVPECANDPDYWFPDARKMMPDEREENIRIAKSICEQCHMKDECLEAALVNEEEYGIFGGLTAKERSAL